MLFEVATILGFVLVLARTAAMVLVAPVFSSGPGFQGYKLAVVFSVSLCLFLGLGMPTPNDTNVLPVVLMILREVFLGLFLGFLLHVVTMIVRVGGELVGQEMGFMVAKQVDPATGIQIPLITSIYDTVFLLALFAMNGHHWLLRGLHGSFERAPIGRIDLAKNAAVLLVELFSQMFGAGIVFAAPVMIFLALVSVMMGLLARVAPQLNVMEIGFTLRVLLGVAAMGLFAPLLEPAFEGIAEKLLFNIERALDAMES